MVATQAPDVRAAWWQLARIEQAYGVILSEHGRLPHGDPFLARAELERRAARSPVLARILAEVGVDAPPESVVLPCDERYPAALANHPLAPWALYTRGSAELLDPDRLRIGIVGSRRARPTHLAHVHDIAADLARAGACIVSGLALGIDARAHAGALAAGGATIAVLPAGLDHLVPHRNRPLAGQILESGGLLLSPYPDDRGPERWQFAARNKVVAGLVRFLLVGQAAARSGTLHTVDEALQMGCEVGAIPGAHDDPACAGSNRHLRDGAHPVLAAIHVLRCLGLDAPAAPPPSQQPPDPLLDALEVPRTLDVLAALVGGEEREVACRLVELELEGAATRLSDGSWAAAGAGWDPSGRS